MCSALSRKNVQVDLLVSSNRNFALSISKKEINQNFRQYELPRINIHPFLNGRMSRGLIALWFGISGKYDIIFARVPTQLESNIPAFFLKLLGKKVVLDWDDYWMGSPIFNGHNLIKKYIKFCETKSPKFFGNMVVISDFLENKAKERGAKKTLKLINGVVVDEFKPRNPAQSFEKLKLNKNKKYLLSIGNTYSRDRTRLLFEAFGQIFRLDPEIKLICNFDLKQKIKEQNLEGKISEACLVNTVGMGYLSHEDLEHCLNICSAAIFLQGQTEDEIACYPVRIGSYLDREVTIVMNDVGSEAGNTMTKYGCAIIDKDIRALAKKTVDFLNDGELQKEMKQKALFAKKDLAWDNLIVKLIDFFEKI
jgi:glycosyltransferase involved in cell wall biosynthesis